MTSYSDALFLMYKTQAHFIQIILSKVSRSVMLLSFILTIDSWKASIMTSRSEISEFHHHSLISRSLWVQQNYQRSINDHFFFHCFLNFLFDSWNNFESLNNKSDKLSIRIWWYLHHYKWFNISSMMIITSDQCFLSKLMILLVAVIIVKYQVVILLTFIMILTWSSVNFIILQLSLSITVHSWFMI